MLKGSCAQKFWIDLCTSHRRPSDLLGQFTEEEKEDGEIQIFSYWTFTVLLGILLRCYKARVTSVEYNKVLMFSHSRSLEAFRVLRISAHIRAIPT